MKNKLLLISADPNLRSAAEAEAGEISVALRAVSSPQQAYELRGESPVESPDAVMIDLLGGNRDEAFQWARKVFPAARTVLLVPTERFAGFTSLTTPHPPAGWRSGEDFLLARSWDAGNFRKFIARLQQIGASIPAGSTETIGLDELIGRSVPFREAIEAAMNAVNERHVPVLISGERGVGKRALARAIHTDSYGFPANYYRIDCTAVTGRAFEAALSGEAFSGGGGVGQISGSGSGGWSGSGAGGASASGLGSDTSGGAGSLPAERPGSGPSGGSGSGPSGGSGSGPSGGSGSGPSGGSGSGPGGGTLLLEEVGALDAARQSRVLNYLAEGYHGIGPHPPNRTPRPRLIAATARNLEDAVQDGKFNRALYSKLTALRISIPPLRERPSDILLLAEQFLSQKSRVEGQPVPTLTRAVQQRLLTHPWPGNIRELFGVLEAAYEASGSGGELRPEHLPDWLMPVSTAVPANSTTGEIPMMGTAGAAIRYCEDGVVVELPEEGIGFDQVEKAILKAALSRTNNNVVRAAKLLRLGRGSLRYRLEKYGLVEPKRRRSAKRRTNPGPDDRRDSWRRAS